MGETLGARIRYLRKKKNMSQKELANQLGIGNAILSRYESGDRLPDAETIARIAAYFKVSADYFLDVYVKENSGPYLSEKDIELIQRIKKTNDMEAFIRDVLNHKGKLDLLKKIWVAIKSS